MSNQISEETQTVFDQIEQERQRQGRFIKLQSGETKTLQFNPNKVQLTEDEYEGKKFKRVHYAVIDSKMPMEGEKILPMSLSNSININALLKEGHKLD